MPIAVALPKHPTTGLTALGIVGGRPVWPAMGGDGTDPNPEGKTGQEGDAPAQEPEPADPLPATDDKGFPENTPVADMTVEQQAAYWKHQARKHETRAKAAPSDTELAELRKAKKERDQLRQEQMTESEKAVEAARAEGRQAAAVEFGERLVVAEFTAAAAGRPVALDALMSGLDRARFLTTEGEPDRDAIRVFVDAIAPAAAEQSPTAPPRGPDLEQGYKQPPTNTPSVSGGADLYAKYKKR